VQIIIIIIIIFIIITRFKNTLCHSQYSEEYVSLQESMAVWQQTHSAKGHFVLFLSLSPDQKLVVPPANLCHKELFAHTENDFPVW